MHVQHTYTHTHTCTHTHIHTHTHTHTHTLTHTHTHTQSDNEEPDLDELNQTLPANFKLHDPSMSIGHNTTASVAASTKQKGTAIVRRQPVARDSRPNVLRHKKEDDGDHVRALRVFCTITAFWLLGLQIYVCMVQTT